MDQTLKKTLDEREWTRRASVENAIASAKLEGLTVTRQMRLILEEHSKGRLSETQIREAILAIARG